MTKMCEAFEKWAASCEYATEQSAFEAGWQSAIAAVKEGGVWAVTAINLEPLYKLPEDAP